MACGRFRKITWFRSTKIKLQSYKVYKANVEHSWLRSESTGDAMRISDTEIKKILNGEYSVVEDIIRHEKVSDIKRENEALIKQVTEEVLNMPDRENMIAELKAKIDAGTYNPSGDEIADAMMRRAVADRLSEH